MSIEHRRIVFESEHNDIVGSLWLPDEFDESARYAAIVVSGPASSAWAPMS